MVSAVLFNSDFLSTCCMLNADVSSKSCRVKARELSHLSCSGKATRRR